MNHNASLNRYNNTDDKNRGRKLTRRPMETPGLESTRSQDTSYSPYVSQVSPQYPGYSSNFSQDSAYSRPTQQENEFHNFVSQPPTFSQQNFSYAPQQQTSFSIPQSITDPMVTNIAVQYGQAIVGSGRKIVDQELEKYVPISRLKYYFAVDTAYVTKKLFIILFPYMHKDWLIKYDQNEPIQPRYEVNAPDLYIPTMAFLTYILVVGLILGTNDEFNPEKLSLRASTALAWSVLELVIQLVTLYISNITTTLRALDLISYSSYKYVGIIIVMLANLFFNHLGYWISLVYVSASLTFFVMRTLKLQVLSEPNQNSQEQNMMYGVSQSTHVGVKRRHYFLLFVACSQPLLMWWMSTAVA